MRRRSVNLCRLVLWPCCGTLTAASKVSKNSHIFLIVWCLRDEPVELVVADTWFLRLVDHLQRRLQRHATVSNRAERCF